MNLLSYVLPLPLRVVRMVYNRKPVFELVGPQGRPIGEFYSAGDAEAIAGQLNEFPRLVECLRAMVHEHGRGELDPEISTHRPAIAARALLASLEEFKS
jgi:hypothetical protein